MSSEIFQSVASDNYDDFQHVNFIFSQIFISLFWGLFNVDQLGISCPIQVPYKCLQFMYLKVP
jgi:hypothetical protein